MADHWRTSRGDLGGFKHHPGSPRALTPRDHINQYFPSGSIWAEPLEPVLKRGQITQATLDVLFVASAFLFVAVTGVGFAFAMFVLLFMHL